MCSGIRKPRHLRGFLVWAVLAQVRLRSGLVGPVYRDRVGKVGQGASGRVDSVERADLRVRVGRDHLLDRLLRPARLRGGTWLGSPSFTFMYQQP
jgi:hypothetical protein